MYTFEGVLFLLCLDLALTSDLPVVERRILNSGFHRDLITEVKIPKSLLSQKDSACYSICRETLPSSVYVDTFQLKSISKHHDFKFISPTLDIEKPEYQSSPFSVLIYSDLHMGPDSVFINVTLPIHLRYHKPDTEYRKFEIKNPDIFIYCTNKDFKGEVIKSEELPCNSEDKKLCNWSLLKYKSDKETISVMVPVGNTHHQSLVVIGTLSVTFGGCLWIVIKVLKTKHKEE